MLGAHSTWVWVNPRGRIECYKFSFLATVLFTPPPHAKSGRPIYPACHFPTDTDICNFYFVNKRNVSLARIFFQYSHNLFFCPLINRQDGIDLKSQQFFVQVDFNRVSVTPSFVCQRILNFFQTSDKCYQFSLEKMKQFHDVFIANVLAEVFIFPAPFFFSLSNDFSSFFPPLPSFHRVTIWKTDLFSLLGCSLHTQFKLTH